jgi:hypothetical protein
VGHYRVVRIGHRAGGAFLALTSLPPGSAPGRQRLIRQLFRILYSLYGIVHATRVSCRIRSGCD